MHFNKSHGLVEFQGRVPNYGFWHDEVTGRRARTEIYLQLQKTKLQKTIGFAADHLMPRSAMIAFRNATVHVAVANLQAAVTHH